MLTNENFNETAARYTDTIYRVAFSWLKNADDANDVTQNVLLKLFRIPTDFASDAYLKNWLIRVTINECKMIFRSPWHKLEDIDAYAETLSFREPDDRALFCAIMKLDAKYRVPLLLFYYEGYSTKEIAAMLKLPPNTVSTRLSRAKSKLKTFLEED